jgi:hypothetical protein
VVLVSRLRAALQRLNPDLPAAALDLAVTERSTTTHFRKISPSI